MVLMKLKGTNILIFIAAALIIASFIALMIFWSQHAQAVTYNTCSDVRKAGKSHLRSGQPGYRLALDRDHDGIACE